MLAEFSTLTTLMRHRLLSAIMLLHHSIFYDMQIRGLGKEEEAQKEVWFLIWEEDKFQTQFKRDNVY